MDRIFKSRWSLNLKRRFVQILSLIGLNSNFGTSSVGSFCLPVMNCNACPISWLNCPIYLLSEAVQGFSIPWLSLAIFAGFGLLFGRFLCGWVCPLGFLQDLLYKIPSRKIQFPRWLASPKYAVFLLLVVGAAFWLTKTHPAFWCNYCPTAALQVKIPLMIQYQKYDIDSKAFLWIGMLLLFFVAAIFNHRSFCKVLCPIGAAMALTNKYTPLRLRLEKARCIHCHACDRKCPMDVPVESCSESGRTISRHTECIECLTCEQTCPTTAIRNNSHLLRK